MKRDLLLLLSFACAISTSAQHTFNVSVSNPSRQSRADQPVVISLQQYGNVRSALVTCNGQEIPCQLDDLDLDENFDELCFLADLDGKQKKQYTVTLSEEGEPRPYPARVYAEMVMSNTRDKKLKKNEQNNYIEAITARGDAAYSYNLQHHHGVDFESELNGIRIYFDARQTLDLYGKFKKQLELKETQFYTSDEQKAARLWRRRAVGGSDVRIGRLSRMGRTATHARGALALKNPAHHQLRPSAHDCRSD